MICKKEGQQMKFKLPYDQSTWTPVDLECVGESLTRQSFKEDCDIYNILRKYEATGLLDHVNRFQGEYADFSDVCDYQDAQNIVLRANEMFETLPSKVRDRFGNSPSEFLKFVNDPNNDAEMYELGLKVKPETVVHNSAIEPKKA